MPRRFPFLPVHLSPKSSGSKQDQQDSPTPPVPIPIQGPAERTDSYLSVPEDAETECILQQQLLIQDDNRSVRYMEEASMETSLQEVNAAAVFNEEMIEECLSPPPVVVRPNGPIGQRYQSRTESEVVNAPPFERMESASLSADEVLISIPDEGSSHHVMEESVYLQDSSRGAFVRPPLSCSLSSHGAAVEEIASRIDPISEVASQASTTTSSSSPANSTQAVRLLTTTLGLLDPDAIVHDGETASSVNPLHTEAQALHLLFQDMCAPAPSLEAAEAALHVERIRTHGSIPAVTRVELPADPVTVLVRPGQPSKVVLLLTMRTEQQQPALLQAPAHFVAALFRLLIRLVTHETDEEYDNACFRHHPPQHTKANQERIIDLTALRQHSNFKTRSPHTLYNMVRLQCPLQSQRIDLMELIWDHLDFTGVHQPVVPAVARWLGLWSVAGISPRQLSRFLSPAPTPTARLALLAAATTAAGASPRAGWQTPAPRDCFVMGGGTGWTKTLSGLASWPFRNDFGLAMWFRVERFFDEKQYHPITLLSARSDDGGGIEVSLVRIPTTASTTAACTIAVSVFDSEKKHRDQPAHSVTVRGCVLLPRVWYHLGVRHTRSRLKGVFSLSTRQQLSILLDGKTLLTDSLPFPKMEGSSNGESSALLGSVRRSMNAGSHSRLNLHLKMGYGLDGETGAIYIFNDSVSDASFRALYELTGGKARRTSRSPAADVWDARKSRILRKARLLDDWHLTTEDAEDLVLLRGCQTATTTTLSASMSSRKRKSVPEKIETILDVGVEQEEQEETAEFPLPLQRASFSSKILIAWDPKRVLENVAIELHMGAHCKLDGVYSWSLFGAQDVVESLGGVQAFLPVFRSFLSLNGEHELLESETLESIHNQPIASAIPALLDLISAFVRDDANNAKEFFRSGAVDVIVDLLGVSKKLAAMKRMKPTFFGAVCSNTQLSVRLVESLLRFESSSSIYPALETKIFSRLVFNPSLWFDQRIENSSLMTVYLPVLSSLARQCPERVRDCIRIRDLVQLLVHLTQSAQEFQGQQKCSAPIILGILFTVMQSGTSPANFSPFLNFLSVKLGVLGSNSNGSHSSGREILIGACTVLVFLLQLRPVVPNLFASFAHCCGSVQDGAAWILCAMVNVEDDEIRALGIRAISAYLEITSSGPDATLALGNAADQNGEPIEQTNSSAEPTSHTLRSSTRLSQRIAEGLAAMGPGARAIGLMQAKLTARVVYKLLWHFLKCHRYEISSFTYNALLFVITEDEMATFKSLSTYESLKFTLIAETDTVQSGFTLNLEWARKTFSSSGSMSNLTFRNSLATLSVLRLLRYLNDEQKDKWLEDMISLSALNRKNVSFLVGLSDWEPSIFQLISDTLESVRAHSVEDQGGTRIQRESKSGEEESHLMLKLIEKRLDLCLDLYAALLGHLLRSGGEKVLDSVETTASLQRTCVNGTDVLLMVLSRFCSNIFEHGVILEMGSISAEDWKDVNLEQDSVLLRHCARLVTDAILSQGSEGLDMPTAVRSWRSLRHLTEVIAAVVIKSGYVCLLPNVKSSEDQYLTLCSCTD